MQQLTADELIIKARELRKTVLTMLTEARSGHTGGSLSIIEILLCLYYHAMRHDPKNPGWPERDRMVLSKGHGCSALYAVLAECGYFPKDMLMGFRKFGSPLQGHPQLGLPGIEASTGSLGQGLSIALGMALACRVDRRGNRIYCLMGDGELNEGQVWEAAMSAAHFHMNTICAIVDYNKLQIDGFCRDIMDIEPLKAKWEAFGWHTQECDGHDIHALMKACDAAAAVKDKPSIILAHTVKGKGVSFIENQVRWHGIAPKPDELKKALEELDGKD